MSGGHGGPEDGRGHTGAIHRRSAGARNGSLTGNDFVPNTSRALSEPLGVLRQATRGERERESEREKEKRETRPRCENRDVV